MVLPRNEKDFIEKKLRALLVSKSLDDILEDFDLDPLETLLNLYESGQLDPEIIMETEIE